jgi:RRXRR protein
MFVPVVDHYQQPLMPTTPARARRWIRSGKATPFWKWGVFCVRLNVEPSAREVQPVAMGIDPGSKKEGYSVISAAHTYLNLQADAVDWVTAAVKRRRQMRRTRANRLRNTQKLPPSTKARWQWKLRLCRWFSSLYPITAFVVEDIKARTAGRRRWDRNFSPTGGGQTVVLSRTSEACPCPD